MTIVSKIQMFELPEQHVLAIRETIHFNDYPKIAQQSFEKIIEFAAGQGMLFSSGPYTCFYNADLENLQVEMGFPIARQNAGNGDVEGYSIPCQRVVSGIFQGAYEETDPLMMEIMQWIADHGFEQKGPIFNYYLNEETRTPNELLTQIAIPIK